LKIFALAGWSGSGKTTLIEKLVPLLRAQRITVSLIKHAHHDFDVDHPGKDSWRHRRAGCTEVLVTSSVRWALMHDLDDEPELTLRGALQKLGPCDLVLVEGYKRAPIPKLEIYRAAVGKPLLFPGDPHVAAIATDSPDAIAAPPIPVLDLDNVPAIAQFVIRNSAVLSFDNGPPDL
jgi:molybdopterin-guanine dinucleotide biosynthesis protein B